MSDLSGGFSFGGGVKPPESEPEEIDAIEVSGEPVSRTEAKNMGLAAYQSGRMTQQSSGTAQIRRAQLPDGVSKEFATKLEAAWAHLKRNEIEEALTLAQEVVWEYPSLVAAKLVIARCFINRKEYEKALAILQAIPESDITPEAMYYMGLCQSRLGRICDAIDTLKKARSDSSDPMIRKRANDLLLHLQGEQTTCPICGKKTLYDSMVEVGNQTVCVNCAKKGVESLEDDDEDEDDLIGGTRRRKRLRPPLSKTDIMIRLLFALFIVAVLLFGVYLLYILMPDTYGYLRSYAPDRWTFLPPAPARRGPVPEPDTPTEAPTPRTPRSTLSFDSMPLANAIAGMEIRHQVYIDGLDVTVTDGYFSVDIFPKPDGQFSIGEKTGDFAWTPTEVDAGKRFEVKFGGRFKNVQARDQINSVFVSPGPNFKELAMWSQPEPGEIMHLLAEDLDGDGRQNLIAIVGKYSEGEVVAFTNAGGTFEVLSSAAFAGRPAGAGVIMANGEKWIAVADYWSARMRHFALRDKNVAEMSFDISLPGRPVLAGFGRDISVSSVLCQMPYSMRVVAYRQENQLTSTKIGEWEVPAEYVWKRLLVLPAGPSAPNREAPIVSVLIGGDAANTILILEQGKSAPSPLKLGVKGTVIDAVLGLDGRVYCLVEDESKLSLLSFNPRPLKGKGNDVTTADAGDAPALGGLAVGNLFGSHAGSDMELMALSATELLVGFVSPAGILGKPVRWNLPTPSSPLRGLAFLAGAGDEPPVAVYLDAEGAFWSAGVDLEGESK